MDARHANVTPRRSAGRFESTRWSWGAVAVAVILAAPTVAIVSSPQAAHAVVTDRLVNGSFETLYNPPTPVDDHYEANEWVETNLLDWSDPDDEIASGQTAAHYVTNGNAGSIYVNDYGTPPDGDYSAVIYPDSNFAAHPPILTQEITTAYVAGRNVDVSGDWYRASGSTVGLEVTLKYATTTTDGNGKEVGVWDVTNCTSSFTTGSGWQSFDVTNFCTNTLPSEKIWEVSLVIQPIGTFDGTGIRVDNFALETDDLQTFTPGSWSTGLTLTELPSSADLIGTSKRYDQTGEQSVADDRVFELYGMKSDGSGATRLTDTGKGHAVPAVNPVDHRQVAASVFTVDWTDDDKYSIITDPARVYVYDLAQDKALAITPTYWSAGLGGIAWTTDGRYIVFGVSGGPYWHLWKADTQNNYALSRVTNATDVCFESDVNVANFSHTAIYRRAPMVNGNCYPSDRIGQIYTADLDTIGSPQEVYDPNDEYATGVAEDGLPYGAYDPDYSADDTGVMFSESVRDDDELVVDGDEDGSYNIHTIAITGGTRGYLYGFPSIRDTDDDGDILDEDWTYLVTPGIQWNPAAADDSEGIAFEIEHDDVNGYTYWGLATFNPYVGETRNYTEKESATGDNGLGYAKFIAGGHHSPSANTAYPSGQGLNVTPTNAYADDGAYAAGFADTEAETETQTYSSWGLDHSVPSGATIDGIRVRLDGVKVSATGSSPHVDVQLSWNGGTSWTSAKSSATWTASDQDLVVGAYNDTWSRTWSASEMANLQVRLSFICTPACPFKAWYLDHLDVRVYWRT